MGAIQAQIRRYADQKQKFFLTYVPAAPHNPFDGTPSRFCRFKKGQMNDFTPLYLNELLYMDWIVSSIVDQLKDTGLLDRTLVVITDDHGEMLGANGGPIGHGWAVTPELANIPLIVMDPDRRGYRVNPTVGSQVDLTPTILDSLGIAVPANQLCEGASLYSGEAAHPRLIVLNSMKQYAVLRGNKLICGDRGNSDSGRFQKSYEIGNHGARTFFTSIPPTNVPAISITEFDRFQQNLLGHYSQYSQYCKPAPQTARR